MHYGALHIMKKFVGEYLDFNKKLRILEVGSLDTNNGKKDLVFRRYFRNNPNWEFVGLDIVAGKNVDVVANDPYNYPFDDNSFDVVISGNTLEHVQDTHKFIREIARLTKDLVCIMVPNNRPYHAYPMDCWRIYPDGLKFLIKDIAGLKILDCKMDGDKEKLDTVCIASKY